MKAIAFGLICSARFNGSTSVCIDISLPKTSTLNHLPRCD
jgi:hypothetical protein